MKVEVAWEPEGCPICGKIGWVYKLGQASKPRCLDCWRDALKFGVISDREYREIRKHVRW